MEKHAAAADVMVAATEAEDFRAAKLIAALGLEICGSNCIRPKSAPPIELRSVGELDRTLWAQVWAQLFPVEDPAEENAAAHKRAQMTTIWEDFLLGKQMRPGVEAALNKGLGSCKGKQFLFTGEKIHAAVVAATGEVEEIVGDGRCFPQLKPWNYKEDREATLAEVIQFLHVVLDDLDENIEELFEMIEVQNKEVAKSRPPSAAGVAPGAADAEDCTVKYVYYRPQEEEEAWERNGEHPPEPWPVLRWIAPVRFSEEKRLEFLRTRAEKAASLAGVAAELHEASDAGFQALLKHGSPSAIGIRELGYLGYETEDELAQHFSDILVRYQLAEFPYRMKPTEGNSRHPLPGGYVEELRAMAGIETYSSPEAAARAMDRFETAKNPCPICKRKEPDGNGCSSMVFYCRDCLAPQSWNYKHHRKAGVAETLAFLVGAILYRQRQIAFLDFGVRVQMVDPNVDYKSLHPQFPPVSRFVRFICVREDN